MTSRMKKTFLTPILPAKSMKKATFQFDFVVHEANKYNFKNQLASI